MCIVLDGKIYYYIIDPMHNRTVLIIKIFVSQIVLIFYSDAEKFFAITVGLS